ncbi:MAG: FkbM family methyltransferase [Phycisphaerales bacterium]|nr:FkbM family methyltransferase [Phycisphaerales bacterium]
MTRLTPTLLNPLRKCIGALRTQRLAVPLVAKLALAGLMLPLFCILLLTLRIVALARGPIEIEAQTDWGGRLLCWPPDLIGLYSWLFGVWEPDLTRFIERRLSDGDGFIDVGANIGYYSILAARCVGRSGRVVSIEASPVVFKTLEQNLAHNAVGSKVRAINKAAAAGPGLVGVYAGPSHNVGLTTTVKERGLPLQSQVEALPLDDLLTSTDIRMARLVKIDVEGAELDVLAGMKGILEQSRPDVEFLVELSPSWWSDTAKRPVDALEPLIAAGFHAYAIPNNYWPWRYLWPRCVSKPVRVRESLTRRVKRLDLVLSRSDSDVL